MGHQNGIPAALAARGLTVETVPGWQTRGSTTFTPQGVVCHWTAGPRGATGRPSLGVVTNGRPGLPGPLCNVYLDRAGIAVVVAAGRANHAGDGGWKTLSGNSSVFGIEAEAAGDGDWTPAQRAAYPRVVAALLDLIGRDASWACGHNEWAPDRKIDIRDWDMPAMRTEVAAVMNDTTTTITPPPTQEDDMTPDQARQLAETHWMLNQLRSTDVPSIKQNTDRLPHIHSQADLGRAEHTNITNGILASLSMLHELAGRSGVEIDEKALATELAPLLTDAVPAVTDADLDRIAQAVADEQARRLTP